MNFGNKYRGEEVLKYLYGKLPVASKLNGGREERMGGADALLLSVRRDAYQHKEMAFDACFIAFNGGFSNFNPNLKERHFYGESISCRVETDESIIDKLIELKRTGRVFHTNAVGNKQRLFAIIDGERVYPRKTERTGNWIPCSLEEMQELCDVERSTLPY